MIVGRNVTSEPERWDGATRVPASKFHRPRRFEGGSLAV